MATDSPRYVTAISIASSYFLQDIISYIKLNPYDFRVEKNIYSLIRPSDGEKIYIHTISCFSTKVTHINMIFADSNVVRTFCVKSLREKTPDFPRSFHVKLVL